MTLRTRRFLGIGLVGGVILIAGTAAAWRPKEPSYSGRSLTFWLRFMEGSTRQQLTEAKSAVRGMGPDAVPALLRRIVAKEPWWKRTLARVPAAHSLFNGLLRPSDHQARHAALAIGFLGADASVTQPRLLRALQDSDPGVRANAALALGVIESPANAKIPALIAGLNDPDERVRKAVIEALGFIGPAAMPALMVTLREQNPAMEWGALNAAGAIIERNVLRRTSTSITIPSEGSPSFATVEVFQGNNGDSVSDALVLFAARLKSSETRTRELAAKLLGEFGSEARPALPALIAARNDGSDEVRMAVQIALDRIGYTGSHPSLTPAPSFRPHDSTPIGARLFPEVESLGVGYAVAPTPRPPAPATKLSVPNVPKN